MLAGLNGLELGRLRMSVGYGGHRKERPLSPIEVGRLLRRAKEDGMSRKDCAMEINLKGTSQIGRFLRILELPEDLQHLVNWGSSKDTIGFSSAFELARVRSADDQRVVAESILVNGLKSKEVRDVVQLCERSGRPIQDCLKEVLRMRTTIDKFYVFIGSISDHNVEDKLAQLSQIQRDLILRTVIDKLSFRGATGRLGRRFFTLVGNEQFIASVNSIGKEGFEAQLRARIEKAIEGGWADC